MGNLKLNLCKFLFLAFIMPTIAFAQDKPQHKVDLSMNRSNNDEVIEPGYTAWRVAQGATDALTIDNVKYTLYVPEGAEYTLRTGWNKTAVQNADNKSKNGRLTYDGLALDPNEVYGTFFLKIEGLPVGQHTLQTYHNCWENPDKFYAAPMTIKYNGALVHDYFDMSFGKAVAADAAIKVVVINIEKEGDVATIEFSTSADKPGTPSKSSQVNAFTRPLCNAFELNTISVTSQAKNPYPASGDTHADVDKSVALKWSPANKDVKNHVLYVGKDSASVAQMTTPLATLTDTTYTINDIYSMDTYYWRVDEVDASGNVTKGGVWYFKPRQLAFPGAEGYGRFAQGGRGGQVYHVTSLSNERVPGTFIYGLLDLKGPRTIVFDVSGVIDMGFLAVFPNPYVTIAGQTAPGKGICIKGANINIGSDIICRHMRFKHGYGDTGNAMGMSGANYAIVDHTTAAWGTDETVSGRGAKNVSFQYSMIAEALGIADHKNYDSGTNHGYAATIDGKIGSWHHNLLVNCQGRNWSMGGGMDGQNKAIGQMDIFNNVVYNWGSRTTDGNCHEVNFVGNYYKMGPATGRKVLFTQQYENVGHEESTWRAYIKGNIRENKDGTLTHDKKNETYNVQLSNGDPGPDYESVVSEPFFPSYAPIHSATDAYKIVVSEAGATMPMRDDQHLRVVDETLNRTYTYVGSRSGIKGQIDHESDAGGWEAYPEDKRGDEFDTDQDGMPNWYEKLINSNPDVANNNDDDDRDGWTLLEGYLEFMANPYLIVKPGEQATVDVKQFFKGFTKSPAYSITTDSNLFTAAVNGSVITVSGGEYGGIGVITMKVTDGDGTTYEKRLSVAVSGEVTGIENVWSEAGIDVAKREFFTLDGKQVTTMKQHELYIMKITETNGNVHSVKVIKN